MCIHIDQIPGGETIKEMQATTGCKINVTQASGADIEREIGLVGTPQAIADAKNAIWEKVDQVVSTPVPNTYRRVLLTTIQREKNSQRRGGGGGGRDHVNQNDSYSQQPNYGQTVAQSTPAQQPQQGDAAAADPYAIYGGYQNYVAMWWSSLGQQGQAAAAAAQPGQGGDQRPPGA